MAKKQIQKNNLKFFLLTEEYIDRKNMPQIHADDYDDFFNLMKNKNIEFKKKSVNPILLTPCQAVNTEKVISMCQNPDSLKKPVIVDNTYKIVDGHHRWATGIRLKKNIKVIMLNIPFSEIFKISKQFLKDKK